jgi:hypothetical protein
MKILSDISAVEIRYKKTLDEERKIEIMQSCAGDDYAQVIVVADSVARLKSSGTHDATAALELCKAMQKTWQIADHNDDEEEDNDNDNDSKQLERLLGTVKQKQGTIKKRCFHCNKKGHRSLHCYFKKKKSGSEKSCAAAVTSVNKTKTKCSHCRKPGHVKSSYWKKYPHKAPSKCSTEASGVFLNNKLHVCNIDVDDTYYVTENVENIYYCTLIVEDGQLDDLASWMGMVESHMGQEDPCTADPYEEICDVSNKKTDNAELSDWLEVQAQAKTHNRQMKELAAGRLEGQQRFVQAEASNGMWGPQVLGPNKQANKMVTRHHVPAY